MLLGGSVTKALGLHLNQLSIRISFTRRMPGYVPSPMNGVTHGCFFIFRPDASVGGSCFRMLLGGMTVTQFIGVGHIGIQNEL